MARCRTTWKKGQSGNPAGVSKEMVAARTYLQRRFAAMKELVGDAIEEAIASGTIESAAMARWMAEQIVGKAKERHELSGPDGEPIKQEITDSTPRFDVDPEKWAKNFQK